MKTKKHSPILRVFHLTIILLSLCLFTVTLSCELTEKSKYFIDKEYFQNALSFYDLKIEEKVIEEAIAEPLDGSEMAEILTAYYLDTNIGSRNSPKSIGLNSLRERVKIWSGIDGYDENLELMKAIWQDLKYFPIPISVDETQEYVSYVDSWGASRSYGGERLHEGTDIMAVENVPGLYPVISMTDGVVTKKGWLEQGGYRLGISGENGGYFYYAHLDSYTDVEVGDNVKAGQIIAYMGDTGYGEEGTRGMFDTHLHLGIYVNVSGEEKAVNPYWILRYLENNVLELEY